MTTPQIIGWMVLVIASFIVGVVVGDTLGRNRAEKERAQDTLK